MSPDHIAHMKWMEMSYIVDITQAPCIYYIHHYCAHWVAWRTGRIGKPVQIRRSLTRYCNW
jgi:hypothetical protein